jgi:hypothetical protein
MNNILSKLLWTAVLAGGVFIAGVARAADRDVIPFQLGTDAPSENAKVLIGHWRKTTIVFESPKDEHLVLHPDGTAENWTATASERSEPTTGRWSVDGKILKLVFGENENARPFTIYEGQLVFPNIQGRRQFWEKID